MIKLNIKPPICDEVRNNDGRKDYAVKIALRDESYVWCRLLFINVKRYLYMIP